MLAGTPMAILLLLLLAGAPPVPQEHGELPRLLVRQDDTVVDRSCLVEVPAGLVVADTNGNGVLQVVAPDVTVRFARDTVLRGASDETSPDRLQGFGIRVRGVRGVRIQGGRIRGFRGGIWASGADDLVVEDVDVSDNFRQHLLSTEAAEAGSDWLWPHENDTNEWLRNYGAGVYVEDSRNVTIRRVRARRVQNGICLDRVEDSRIYDNDCSFLSGWGLALWRSSRNLVSRNAFDFCVRGYSHGVYSRGQDSAGILCFEQSQENVFIENSATHSGDGFFGFAGREALGEHPAPERGFRYEGRGCNRNLLVGNDFSYAPAIGIEMTFSFGNRFLRNRLVGGNYGVWGGYSQDTLIQGNTIADNTIAGVAIEHGAGNRIVDNDFSGNARGVQLWWDVDEGLFDRPWVQANHRGLVDNRILHNRFRGDQVAIELRREGRSRKVPRKMSTVLSGNQMEDVGERLRVLGDADPPKVVEQPAPPEPRLELTVLGETRPVGARDHLAGRQNIIMTEWGPWDHESPLLRLVADRGREQVWAVHGFPEAPEFRVLDGVVDVFLAPPDPATAPPRLVVRSPEPGVHPYRVALVAGEVRREAAGILVHADWRLAIFPWTLDPLQDLEGWRREGRAAELQATVSRLALPFGYGGPSQQAVLGDAVRAANLAGDHFGVLASARIPLPAGRWRLRTTSDDGIRVFVDGRVLLERWDIHGPTADQAEFETRRAHAVEIRVEYFENDGYAVLDVALEPAAAAR